MKNKHAFNLEILESRTLFAGAGEDIEFGGDSGILSHMAFLWGMDDIHNHDTQGDSDPVACHTEPVDEAVTHDDMHSAQPADESEDKGKKTRSSRHETSDFDWYFKKKSSSKIPEPRFSHKVMREYKPKPLSGEKHTASIQLESFSDLGNLAFNAGAAVVNGATNLLIGSPSPDSGTPSFVRYISGLATIGLFLKTFHHQHMGRF